MKKFTRSALATAVVLGAGNAYAGTEACFEVYKAATDADVIAHGTTYNVASCGARTGATDTALQANNAATVAWELAGSLNIDFDNVNGAAERTHIVYIPTTDVPGGSRITMELGGGANWGSANANKMYLVAALDHDGNGGTPDQYKSIASAVGAFDNLTEVTFLTSSGVDVSAGTRLALSTTNPSDVDEDGALLEPPHINYQNTDTCPTATNVTIAATVAETDSGQPIIGATTLHSSVNDASSPIVDASRETILDTSEQYVLLSAGTQNATRSVLVDAEDPSLRTNFVSTNGPAAITDAADWTNQNTDTEAFWEAVFINKGNSLDQSIPALVATDTVDLNVVSTGSTGAGVDLSVVVDITEPNSVSLLDATEDTHIAAGATATLVSATNAATSTTITTTSQAFTSEASEYFQANGATARTTNALVKLENDGTLMDFKYTVGSTWDMNFSNVNYRSKVGCKTQDLFEVGVNGAILKVPYMADGSFVRITNEHADQATVYMDIFDMSSEETQNVVVGTVDPKASTLFKTDDLLDAARNFVDDPYNDDGQNQHTMTFTVTAPADKVHGVAVMKRGNLPERVMPVLDQNSWSQ